MKKLLLSAALLCSISLTGFAQTEEFRGGGVTVPSINDKANWDNALKGDVLLDTSDNNFYGLDNTGTWRNISAVSTPASASSSGYVDTTTQTFAGDKTFNGSISPTGGIVGYTGGAPTSTMVGYTVTNSFDVNTATSGTISTPTSVPLSAGVWRVFIQATVTGAASLVGGYVGISTDSMTTTFSDLNPLDANYGSFAHSNGASADSGPRTEIYVVVASGTPSYYAKVFVNGANTRVRGRLRAVRII